MKSLAIAAAATLSALVSASAGEPWTLDRALDFALAHSPDARIAQQRIAAARAGVQQANSALWPKVQLQSGYQRTDSPMMAFGNILNQRAFDPALNFNNVPETDDVNVRALVTAPLYAGGKITADRAAAGANRRAAKLDESATRNSLEFEVVRAFLTIHKTRQFLRSFEASAHSLAQNLAIAHRRLAGGALLKAEVLDIEVRLAQANDALLRARNANSLANLALQNLIGLEHQAVFSVSDGLPPIPAPPSAPLSDRAELAALRERAEAAQSRARAARSGHKPRVSAFVNADYKYGTVTRGDGRSYAAGVVAQWDIWDGFATRSRIAEEEARAASLREEERKVRLAIEMEAEEARLNLNAAGERLAATEKSILQAAESLKLTRDRFDQGLALAAQLIEAETALLSAQVLRAETEADQRIAAAALRKALGVPQRDPAATPR